uniref:T10O24.1 n=1 Tax=Arabidopsis thaliana TaxID=3702 RepID=Q9XIK9_ARATH|nr:T10O24.1 [Arabidopsis thaliana]
MGGCVSTPKSCVGAKLRSSKRRKSRRRRKIQRKRAAVSSRLSDGSFDNLDHHHRNFSNPSSRGLSFLRLSVSSAFD